MKNLIWNKNFDIANHTPEQTYAGLFCASKNPNRTKHENPHKRSRFNTHKI